MKKQFNLYQKLGSQLILAGKKFLRQATPISKCVFVKYTIQKAIQDKTGIVPALYDEKYHTTDIETWKTIIKNDWTNKRKYVTNTFDCDNFSNAFCAYCADIYELNSAGRFSVELLDANTGKHIGYHRAVIIIDNKLECWLLESQTDKIVKIGKGRIPVIGGWKYKVNFIGIN